MSSAVAFQLHMLLLTLANTFFNQVSSNFWTFDLQKQNFSLEMVVDFDVLGMFLPTALLNPLRVFGIYLGSFRGPLGCFLVSLDASCGPRADRFRLFCVLWLDFGNALGLGDRTGEVPTGCASTRAGQRPARQMPGPCHSTLSAFIVLGCVIIWVGHDIGGGSK